MSIPRSVPWLGLLAALLLTALLLITLPATLVLQAVDVSDRLVRPEGTLWSGQARWQQPGQPPLPIEWRWAGGRNWHWRASDGSTDLQGLWRPGRTLQLPTVQGQLAMDRLDLAHWLRVSRPLGVLELALEQVELAQGKAPQAKGEVVWREAGLAGAIQESLGQIRLQLHPAGMELRMEVQSLAPAAIRIHGHIVMDAQHYDLDLWLSSDPARPELQLALLDLGQAEPDGQVRWRLRGATGL